MPQKEYVRLEISDIPDDGIEHRQLNDKTTKDGMFYVSIGRGPRNIWFSSEWYILAQELLNK